MEEDKQIGQHIVSFFLEEENKDIHDSVLEDWLAESESNRKDFDRYKKIWKESPHYIEVDTFDTTYAWKKIDTTNQQRMRLRGRLKNFCYTLSGIAASALICILLSLAGLFETEPDTLLSIATNYGNRSEVILPDGSLVKLNAGSHISYSFDKKKNIREVNFQGEGFFHVSKNKTPFIISMTDGLQIKVLGTSFNLRAYANDQTIQTSLVEGQIELNHAAGKLTLHPGEIAAYHKATNSLRQETGILQHTYGWIDNKLYMDNMSLADICKQMERWYNVNIICPENLANKLHYNGVLQEESITDIMDALCRLSDIKYEMKGKNIHITSKQIAYGIK